MTDSNVYLPPANSTESCDTSYSSSKEEMEVASTVQPYEVSHLQFSGQEFRCCGVIPLANRVD